MTRAIAASIGITLLAVAPGYARTWTVGGQGADFPFIAPAIAASSPHDVIQIRRGAYREDLVIDRPLTLVGDDGAVLFGTGRGTVIEIAAPDCEVRGLTIDGTGTGDTNQMDAAIRVAARDARIIGNRMRRAFYGVVVDGAAGTLIERNDIRGLDALPFGQRGDGIYLYRAPGTRIVGNRIAGMRDAIYFQYAPGGSVEDNVVESSRYGLHDMFSDGTRIAGNVFRACSAGANLMNSSGLVLERNEFASNRGVAAVGLTLKDCDRSEIRANRFAANGRGLQLDGSTGNRFTANRFVHNDTAVRLLSSAECNVFSGNEFIGNWSDVVASGGTSGNEWSAAGVGNRWSAYDGFDFDGDGIGDQPYAPGGPFEKIEGINPQARLFLRSPAATALALLARASARQSELIDVRPIVRTSAGNSIMPFAVGLAAMAAAVAAARRVRTGGGDRCSS